MLVSACTALTFPAAQAAVVSEWNPGQGNVTVLSANTADLANTGGGNVLFMRDYSIVDATTSGTTLDKAIQVNTSESNAGTGTEAFFDGSSSRTFEMWVNFGGSVAASTVMWETGGNANGFSVKTTASGGLEFNHDSGSDSTQTSISLSGFTLTDYIQIVGVVDATGSQFLLQAKDVNGTAATSGFVALGNTASGTGSRASLGAIAAGNAQTITSAAADSGGDDASSTAGTANKFGGEMGLFRIYDTATTAEADSNYLTVIPEPTVMGLIGFFGIATLITRRL